MHATFWKAFGLGVLLLARADFSSADATVDWPSYNRDPAADRFVPLTDITPRNAADLREVCEVVLGDGGALQPGPVVIGDTLYVTTIHTIVAVGASKLSPPLMDSEVGAVAEYVETLK
jgi:alcohol dehydrogenase (cytochrome c)